MANEQYVFLECIQILKLKISLLAELFELVKLIDKPSYHKNKSLDLANELVGQIDLVNLGVESLTVIRIIFFLQLAFSYNLKLPSFFFKHSYDIDLILHTLFIFLRLHVFFVSFSEFFPKYLTNYHNGVVSFL